MSKKANKNDSKDIAMKEYDEKDDEEKDLDEAEKGKAGEEEEEEEEKNQFPNAWDPNPMILVSKLFLIIPAAVCSSIYLAIVICALIIPSPTWYTVTMQIMVVPCYLFATLGGVSGILGAAFLPKNQFVCRSMLNFYRLSQYFAQTVTAFLSEFVGMCIAFESASGSMQSTYFDFERKRIEYMNQFHNAFFPGDSDLAIKISTGLYIALTIMLVVSNLTNSCFGVTRFSNVVIGDKMNSRIYGYVSLFRIFFMCIVEFNAADGYPPWGMFGFGKFRILWGAIYAVLGVLVLVALLVYVVYFHCLWYRAHPFSLADLQAKYEAIPLVPVLQPVAPISDASQDTHTGKDTPNADPVGSDTPTGDTTPNGGNKTPTDTDSKRSNSSRSGSRNGNTADNISHPRPTSSQKPKKEKESNAATAAVEEAAPGIETKSAEDAAAAAPPQTTASGLPIFYCPDGVTPLPLDPPLLFSEGQHKVLQNLRYFLTITLIVTLIASIVTWIFSLYYFIVIGVIAIMHDNTATYHIPMMDASVGDNINYYNLYVSVDLDGDPENDNVVAVYRIADFIETVSVKGLTTSAVMAIFFYGFGMISSGMFWWCFVFSVTKDNNNIIKGFENSFQDIDVRLIAEAKVKKEAWIRKQEEDAAKKANAARELEERKAAKAERKAARKAAKAEKKAAEAAAGGGGGEDAGASSAGGDQASVDSKVRAALSGVTIIAASSDGVNDRRSGSSGNSGSGNRNGSPSGSMGLTLGSSGSKVHVLEDESDDEDAVVIGVSNGQQQAAVVLDEYEGNMPVFDLN